jgi:hypothetical protein
VVTVAPTPIPRHLRGSGRALRHMGGAGYANHCHQTELALSRSLSGGEGQAPNATPAASRSIGSSVWKDEASLAFALGLSVECLELETERQCWQGAQEA